jgi:tRNA pseudouridine38-40 synthase
LFERNVDVCEWQDESAAILVLRIEAKSFMRNQVRVLVGTMLEVGGGRRSLDDLRALLEGAERSAAGETAPPHGLYLSEVRY